MRGQPEPGDGATLPYRSTQAFSAAIADRLKRLAAESPHNVSQLRRQLAYDRLLARVFIRSDDQWILKGGVAMLARLPAARHSADVDLAAGLDSPEAAVDALRSAATADLGDFFTFQIGAPRGLVQGLAGLRVPIEARLGPRTYERFGVDVVTGAVITGPPERGGPLVPLDIPGLAHPDYRLYPLVDTVADKVAGIIEDHHGRPSTRFRDLVDLVLIARTQELDATSLAVALGSERLRRGLPFVKSLDVPDAVVWQAGYSRAATAAPRLPERSLRDALITAKGFLDPVLSGQVQAARWSPQTMGWE